MLSDYITHDAAVILITSVFSFIIGFVLACLDYDSGYEHGWSQGVEDVVKIINLWEEIE